MARVGARDGPMGHSADSAAIAMAGRAVISVVASTATDETMISTMTNTAMDLSWPFRGMPLGAVIRRNYYVENHPFTSRDAAGMVGMRRRVASRASYYSGLDIA